MTFQALSEDADSLCEWALVVTPRDRRRGLHAGSVGVLHNLPGHILRNRVPRLEWSGLWILRSLLWLTFGIRGLLRVLRLLCPSGHRKTKQSEGKNYTNTETQSAQV